MKLTIEKPKIRKGMSYALQTSLLQEALRDFPFDINVLLKYRIPNHFDDKFPIFSCELWPPNPRVDQERYYIVISPIKPEDKKRVEELVKQKVLPEFLTWLKRRVALPDNSTYRDQRHYFKAIFSNDQVALSSSS
ncbi:hypothetical protein AHMF7605_11405 [Adhaeribacter arboris]|uniref:Uncharacterized protein n=1 Tax=Adhaeribacter arboris TaxID=2072846 RepID=A0A2T2YF08_9BACT|nr:hypothetical protein [Adhaeribacter arboris]PSR54084.1 hypothetical protein AHMF7605_11405 [Adhaeribacter arboris]